MAGAAAAAQLEREIYMDELAQSQEDIARLQREAETAEKAREAAESKRLAAITELAAARRVIEDLSVSQSVICSRY